MTSIIVSTRLINGGICFPSCYWDRTTLFFKQRKQIISVIYNDWAIKCWCQAVVCPATGRSICLPPSCRQERTRESQQLWVLLCLRVHNWEPQGQGMIPVLLGALGFSTELHPLAHRAQANLNLPKDPEHNKTLLQNKNPAVFASVAKLFL